GAGGTTCLGISAIPPSVMAPAPVPPVPAVCIIEPAPPAPLMPPAPELPALVFVLLLETRENSSSPDESGAFVQPQSAHRARTAHPQCRSLIRTPPQARRVRAG